ncbi:MULTISPECIES: sigma-54-dependent transcriptional regulator [Sphingomonas]|uniref:sigma-54-dependent transcriptional regulator n=1 Tax=Sphingomonas TaxID=13687 RepID=UPI0008347905|nr:sigma-54 dependent transcriptional regulator [Sphingomonas sp. CCH10-B3]
MLFATHQPVCFVEDDPALREATVQTLELAGFSVEAFASADRALPGIGRDFAGAIVSDIRMRGMDGLQLFARVRAIDPDIPVILVTGHADVAMAVGALREGAFDFITKPFATDHLIAATRRALEKRLLVLDNRRLRAAAEAQGEADPLVGESAAIARLRATIRQVAASDIDVLVEGETGTGKELVATMIHRSSPRRGRPLIAVNCGALPEALAETELFGHAADAVAHTRLARAGQIENSSGGTLLLDEIDSMPLPVQSKLLRVLEEREVQPIGAPRPRAVDLRVIATSKADLAGLVAQGRFRQDLFYRLNVVRLQVPPLRDRREDIAPLFALFVEEAQARADGAAFTLTEAVRRHLTSHDWPGNVRELRNYAVQAVLGFTQAPGVTPDTSGYPLAERVRRFEASVIEDVLRQTGGNVTAAQAILQTPRKTLYEKMARHAIDAADYRRRRD